ncbi:cytochrome-c peroxidase [Taklimakanibacter deserti]|uniref:cytochrome-c peroxidase n=1 Tax=Taklimakanibacter deserti TaxID=2267839 RepID=UPI0034D57209
MATNSGWNRQGREPGKLSLLILALLATMTAVASPLASEEPISPTQEHTPSDRKKIALGESLFHDVRLSHGDVVSCASCHGLDQGGDDGQARTRAANGRLLDFNTPTVFNAALNFRFNWRGNFRSLEAQNEAALLDPSLMNTTWPELLTKLSTNSTYTGHFFAVYGKLPNRQNVLDALAAFQRSLVTPDAPFDRYLKGDRQAMKAEEKRGYELFKNYGCMACHQGINVGGNLFQKFGIFADPFVGQASISKADLGRMTVTGRGADRHVFRVPSLRNVMLTAPYFHDGRTTSLSEAVRIMARNQLGRELGARDVADIVAFLATLTGEYRGRALSSQPDPRP